ncbi:MAG: dTDP-4-dehydrorhamnose reductase, partial [Enterobacterales bacterium]
MLIIMVKHQSILVTGSSGQLALSLRSVSKEFPHFHFSFVTREELDLSDLGGIKTFFDNQHFDVIINCAAYTAVDQAEQEPEQADIINHIAVKTLAEIAKNNDSVLIQISTDYVFDGQAYRPYVESDTTSPKSVYGSTKLKGENAIAQTACKGAIIRTSWLYSEFGQNFVKTMLRLGQDRQQLNIIFDQVGTATYARDLAIAILEMINLNDGKWSDNAGVPIYHYSNEGVCSWFDFAKAIFELSGI